MKNILTILILLISSACFSQAVKDVQVSPAGPPVATQVGLDSTKGNLRTEIETKLFTSDSSLMLDPYGNAIDINTDSIISIHAQVVGLANTALLKLNLADTASMLSADRALNNLNKDSINSIHAQILGLAGTGLLKLNISDTASMLSADRALNNLNKDSINSIHAQILGLAGTGLLKLNLSDTASMLSADRALNNLNKDSVNSIHAQILGLAATDLLKRNISDTSTNGVATFYSRDYLRDSLNLVNKRALGDSSYGLAPVSNAWFFGTSITVGNSLYYRYSTAVANLINMYEVNRGTGGSYMKFTSTGDSSMVDKIYTIPNNSSSVGKVFFEFGTNDAEIGDTSGFRLAYHRVMDSATIARSIPASKIVLLSIHYRLKPAASLPRDTTYNRIIHEVATAYGATYIDTRTPGFGIESTLSTDSVHPLIQGHYIIARATLDGVPDKNKGYLFEKGTIVANKLSVEGRMGSDNGGASSSGTAAIFATYFEAGANNQSFYQATFAPNINANGFTGGIAYAARFRAHAIFDNNKTLFGTKADGTTFNMFNINGSNLASIGQNNTALTIFGNQLNFDYRNTMIWTDNNSGSKTFSMFATSGNALIKTAGTHADTAAYKLNVSGNVHLTGMLDISVGTNSSMNTATLINGTATVSTTQVKTGSRIFLQLNTPGGTLGINYSAPVASIVNNTSFVINSVDAAGAVVATDTSTINWWIVGGL